jgi:hypothetical protein
MNMTFQEIRIIATVPCIANQLRDINTICNFPKPVITISKGSNFVVNMPQQVVGISMGTNCAPLLADLFDFKIEVVPFIINFSTELTTVVKFEVEVQK